MTGPTPNKPIAERVADRRLALAEGGKQADGGPAFPCPIPHSDKGMSLRDYLAAAALQGLLSNPNAMDMEGETPEPEEVWEMFALLSYAHADAMLKAREP